MHEVTRRPWVPADVAFLWDMLFESLHVRDGGEPFRRDVLERPEIAHYLIDFGQHAGDDAQVAEIDGARIGAAWCRRLDARDPGYGYVADGIPELGMAVRSDWRGGGIGRSLLGDLLDRNPMMSLSVDDENVEAAYLYRSLGFVVHGGSNGSTTMVRWDG